MIDATAGDGKPSVNDAIRPAHGDLPKTINESAARIEEYMHVLCEPGQVVELRAIEVDVGRGWKQTFGGFFNDYKKLAIEAARVTRSAQGVYWTLNPLKKDILARRCNRIEKAGQGELADDKDVTHRRWLLIDADVRRTVKKISSTDAEKAATLEVIERICEGLRALTWPEAVFADSGNGYHLLYRVDLPADDGDLLKRALHVLAERYDTDAVEIDLSVFNPGRIDKLYGTWARKGDNIPERPHRYSRILEIPETLTPVPKELLEALAAEYREPKTPQSKTYTHGGNGTHSNGDGKYTSKLIVPRYLQAYGIAHRLKNGESNGRTIYILDQCPFDPSHGSNGEVCVMQDREGKLSAKCMHNSCSGRDWQAFKAAIGKPKAEHYDPPLDPEKKKKKRKKKETPTAPAPKTDGLPFEAPDDPHRLARLCLWDRASDMFRKTNEVPDSHIKIRYWREEFHEWDGTRYEAINAKEMRAIVAEKIKAEFDAQYYEELAFYKQKALTDEDAEPPVARRVTGHLVSDTMTALSGMTLLPGSFESPAWISGEGPFPASEMLPCKNMLVHLPSFVDGRDTWFCDRTNDFFTLQNLGYDFVENPPEPTAWLDFLHRIWPNDSEAIATLQEWFGYNLLLDTSQQKILFVVGPKRSGKGTIARVLRALVGEANTVAPTLSSLSTNFGLWPLLGKSVAIISDARLSYRTDAAVVVERLLSISGEDAQTVDRKNLASVTTVLKTRFMILTNELPKLNDPSGALVSRLVLLRLTKSWYGHEDHTLTKRLLGELPAILRWSIEGWRRLQERGEFVQPKSGEKMIEDLDGLSSPIRAYLAERCVVDDGCEVFVRDLWCDWCDWCKGIGRKETGTEQTFGRDMRAAVPTLDVRQSRWEAGRVRVYVGVRLKTEQERNYVECGTQ